MAWQVEFDERAAKELKKIGPSEARKVIDYLEKKIATDEDPRRFGKPLLGDKKGLWRYRVDDYRIICTIEDDKLVVLVLRVGHRKLIYD